MVMSAFQVSQGYILYHMVGYPEPHVLKVARGTRFDVHHQAGGDASLVDTACCRWALARRKLRSDSATNANVAV